ncbi:MAG: lysylphosphatidylglycerol synthase transmembrane domain-containing protein [Solirubrobacterales bacterium]
MPNFLVDMPLGDLSSSLEHFFNATTEFFRHLSEVHWSQFGLALLCLLAMQLARAWAWHNVLRAAYPGKRIGFTRLSAAYLAGAGINAVIPAHAGDVTKVFLVKLQIPDSSYPAVTSSFLVQTVFDTSVGVLVLLYAITQGLLPPLPELPHLPAFEVSFWANHPKTLAITVVALIVAIVIAVLLLARRVRRFWQRVKQGLVILTRPGDYMKQVFAWQGVGWLFRFAAFWFFLEAFGLEGSIGNVMLVMSVQAIANIVPFTPGGAGAQQALLVATLSGPSRAAVLSFSVGTQIAMAAWSVVLGFAAILLVFRTTDWRGLIRQAQEDQDREGEGGEGGNGDQGGSGAAGCEGTATPSSA